MFPFFTNGETVSQDQDEIFFLKRNREDPAVLFSNNVDPYSTFALFVLKRREQMENLMSLLSNGSKENNELKHYYNIRYTESDDGILWDRKELFVDFC